MSKAQSIHSTEIPPNSLPLGQGDLLSLLDSLTCPISFLAALWISTLLLGVDAIGAHVLLSLLIFALTFPGNSRLRSSDKTVALGILMNWFWVFGLIALAGYSSGYVHEFSQQELIVWLCITPFVEYGMTYLVRWAAPFVVQLQGGVQPAILVGFNEQGRAFGDRLVQSPYSRIHLVGFVDSRGQDRLNCKDFRLLGKLDDLERLIRAHAVKLVYISLPMSSQPRILQVLDSLKDTTASIYFVPDMFVTDLIQGHTAMVSGTTVIAVCETPFAGLNAMLKRGSDLILASLIVLLISPLLAALAIAVKTTSQGPVIFKQRRYGLDGQEIVVYKFRSMTATEDGMQVTQAQKFDTRVTPVGAFLRKSSMDELPQFINVLQGRMSIVGPRPHAVAHNEFYRKLIKGYMVRHKVKPGITGWAQVNGLRGETETLDKMENRIAFDLDYLRNWSLKLDIQIILRTIRLVIKDQQAY